MKKTSCLNLSLVQYVGVCLKKNRPGNNRLGGNSLLECAVFGRLAGANAAEKALKETETFESQV